MVASQNDVPDLTKFIRRAVEIESPSDDAGAAQRFLKWLEEETADIASAEWIEGCLRLDFYVGGKGKRNLAIGHADTVWPMGTLAHMPFRESEGRLWGPGVLDMKSGLALLIFAVRRALGNQIAVRRPLSLLVVTDEEIGSPKSRAITEREALRSEHVLVLEPGTGLSGKLKTARKGVGHYTIRVHGKAAHAGVDFENGASAILEAAKIVQDCAALTKLSVGTTVNPGVISGGTRSNVIAEEAAIEVDVRVVDQEEARRIDEALRGLRASDPRCRIEVKGGLNRPPMVRDAELFARVKAIAADADIEVEESSTGGGSDGNFTAALGIPTIDGLGAVGEGAHAANESVVVGYLPQRLDLITALIANL